MTRKSPLAAAAALTIVMLAGAGTAAMADGLSREVLIVNNTDDIITRVHATHVDDQNWGRDLLGRARIFPGDAEWVEPRRNQGYCLFDVRIEFADRPDQQFPALNLCEALSIEVGDWRSSIEYVDGRHRRLR